MKRIGDRGFLFAWQRTRAATQPNPEATEWRIGEVACRRYRQSVTAPEHSVSHDICHVALERGTGGWHIIVTAENCWDSKRTLIRSQLWAVHVSGPKEKALAWFHDEAGRREPGEEP